MSSQMHYERSPIEIKMARNILQEISENNITSISNSNEIDHEIGGRTELLSETYWISRRLLH